MEIRIVSNTDTTGYENSYEDEARFFNRYWDEPFIVQVNGERLPPMNKFSISLDAKKMLGENAEAWEYSAIFQNPIDALSEAQLKHFHVDERE